MSNTHQIADTAAEIQAICADHLPACIISGGSPTVPTPPSLVLAAFATEGYVRDTDDLVYVNQEAHSITLTGSDGNYWLALATDNWTSYAQWTTEPGTAYRWRPSATQPADVAGLLTFASVTVAGGAVSAVSPLATVTRAAAGRALLGLGTLATQNANAVAITGGSITGLSTLQSVGPGEVQGDFTTYGNAQVNGNLALGPGSNIIGNTRLELRYLHASTYGIHIRPTDQDTGPGTALLFTNLGDTIVGTIACTATATAYNTSSDRRLKTAITPLTGARAIVQALNPIAYRWRADDSPGVGFAADEVQQVVAGVVTGQPDAVDAAGEIVPQLIDLSKLVPYLTAALKETLAQVDALTARVQALEARA